MLSLFNKMVDNVKNRFFSSQRDESQKTTDELILAQPEALTDPLLSQQSNQNKPLDSTIQINAMLKKTKISYWDANQGTWHPHEIDLSLPNNERFLAHYQNEMPGFVASLFSQVFIGIGRDIPWSVAALRNIDYFAGKKEATFVGSTISQMIFTLLPTYIATTLPIGAYEKVFIFEENKTNWSKKILSMAVASWTAIPLWNVSQNLGYQFGKVLNMTDTSAGYFSGLFCGITESIWQNAFVLPLMLKQQINPLEVMLNFLGGAVWQWIYQAHIPHEHNQNESDLNDFMIALQIALGVAGSTLVMTVLANYIQPKLAKLIEQCHEKLNTAIEKNQNKNENEIEMSLLNAKQHQNYGTMNDKTSSLQTNTVFKVEHNNALTQNMSETPSSEVYVI